jgi:hypothetical protein
MQLLNAELLLLQGVIE